MTDSEKIESLVQAAFNNDLVTLDHYIKKVDDINMEGVNTRAIHAAVEAENIEVIMKLIEAGAFIDMLESRSGFTPLHLAIENEVIYHTENFSDLNIPMGISKLLIDMGANLNALNKDGVSCISYAKERFHNNAYNYMILRGGN